MVFQASVDLIVELRRLLGVEFCDVLGNFIVTNAHESTSFVHLAYTYECAIGVS